MEASNSTLGMANSSRDRDAQYAWLSEHIDPGSTLEKDVLNYLCQNETRRPTFAQHQPSEAVYLRGDFFCERVGVPGVCIFVDRPHRDEPGQATHAEVVRDQLRDLGFRVIVLRHDLMTEETVGQHPDIFGQSSGHSGGITPVPSRRASNDSALPTAADDRADRMLVCLIFQGESRATNYAPFRHFPPPYHSTQGETPPEGWQDSAAKKTSEAR